jgi:hypothetical protein
MAISLKIRNEVRTYETAMEAARNFTAFWIAENILTWVDRSKSDIYICALVCEAYCVALTDNTEQTDKSINHNIFDTVSRMREPLVY